MNIVNTVSGLVSKVRSISSPVLDIGSTHTAEVVVRHKYEMRYPDSKPEVVFSNRENGLHFVSFNLDIYNGTKPNDEGIVTYTKHGDSYKVLKFTKR